MLHAYGTSAQPTVCTLEIVHSLIEFVEVPVAEEVIIDDIPLAPGILI